MTQDTQHSIRGRRTLFANSFYLGALLFATLICRVNTASPTPPKGLHIAEANSGDESVLIRHLGTMSGYYRNTAVLDRALAPGSMMWRIPEWMTRTDFPYSKSDFQTEAPFTDTVTTVRLLGGWRDPKLPDKRSSDPNDLVQRNENGELFYRWDLLKARLDPYVERNYGITIVLDNVPFALARDPKVEHFGQVSPPADMDEWYRFIRNLAEELKRLYGKERANFFRFRIGTEMQDERRFAGTFEDYLQFYDHAALAIKEVLPNARVGPFNRSMPKGAFTEFDRDVGGNVSIVALAEHAAVGTNRATGKIGSPFDFLARSLYYFSSIDNESNLINFHPEQRLPEFKRLWDRVKTIDPKYEHFSREVHEMGPHLNTEGGIYGLDTGARGAAQTLDTLIGLRAIGTDRIWHWELFEKVDSTHTLLMSQGWLYSIFDHMLGGQEYIVPVASEGKADSRQRGYLSVKEDEAILLVANWNIDRAIEGETELSVTLPYDILPSDMELAGAINFNEQSSVFDVIRTDLAKAGLLAEKHVEHRGRPATTLLKTGYTSMASDPNAVREFVIKNWETYASLMSQSLQLGKFNGSIRNTKDNRTATWAAELPSVQVLVFRRSLIKAAPAIEASTKEFMSAASPLEPFWRYSAALGPFHEGGQGLHRIPEHALSGDFPYRKRPFPKEVPFADHLSLVRILGGFNDGSDKGESDSSVHARDLAYRDATGTIQTRFELLEPRLRPYLENGYADFTIVLDNVPWAFPERPAAYGLGQYAPPADMTEWHQFVIDLSLELQRLLPPEALERLRFRIGTEMNDKRRFSGSQEQFENFYAASVAGIRKVLPEAPISFYNIAGASIYGIDKAHNVNAFELVESNLRESNAFTNELAPAIDFISLTRYFSMGIDLNANVTVANAVWNEFEHRYPALKGVAREIHEFGVAPFGEQRGADKIVSQESGALGAASTALMVMLLHEVGIDALWHWNQGELIDRFRDSKGKMHFLFTGVAWFYQILDHMQGGQAYLLRPVEALPDDTLALGLLSVLPDRCLLLVASYDQNLSAVENQSLTFPLPEAVVSKQTAKDIRLTRLDSKSAAHRRIRDDLLEAKLLKGNFIERADRLGSVRQMSRDKEGEHLIGDRFDVYAALYAESLKLRSPLTDDNLSLNIDSKQASLTLDMEVPSMLVIEWSLPK